MIDKTLKQLKAEIEAAYPGDVVAEISATRNGPLQPSGKFARVFEARLIVQHPLLQGATITMLVDVFAGIRRNADGTWKAFVAEHVHEPHIGGIPGEPGNTYKLGSMGRSEAHMVRVLYSAAFDAALWLSRKAQRDYDRWTLVAQARNLYAAWERYETWLPKAPPYLKEDE